jgi:antitoxin CcdA
VLEAGGVVLGEIHPLVWTPLCAYYAHRRMILMKATYNLAARKRPVNLTLNEDLVAQARRMTDNLSEVVESLLAEFLIMEKRRRAAEAQTLHATVETWNQFAEKHGSFADQHSTL